jgi:hypothetical protein
MGIAISPPPQQFFGPAHGIPPLPAPPAASAPGLNFYAPSNPVAHGLGGGLGPNTDLFQKTGNPGMTLPGNLSLPPAGFNPQNALLANQQMAFATIQQRWLEQWLQRQAQQFPASLPVQGPLPQMAPAPQQSAVQPSPFAIPLAQTAMPLPSSFPTPAAATPPIQQPTPAMPTASVTQAVPSPAGQSFNTLPISDLNAAIASPRSPDEKLSALNEIANRQIGDRQTYELLKQEIARPMQGIPPETATSIRQAALIALGSLNSSPANNRLRGDELDGIKADKSKGNGHNRGEIEKILADKNENPMIKATAVAAVGYMLSARPHDKELQRLLKLAEKDPNPDVKVAVAQARKINS